MQIGTDNDTGEIDTESEAAETTLARALDTLRRDPARRSRARVLLLPAALQTSTPGRDALHTHTPSTLIAPLVPEAQADDMPVCVVRAVLAALTQPAPNATGAPRSRLAALIAHTASRLEVLLPEAGEPDRAFDTAAHLIADRLVALDPDLERGIARVIARAWHPAWHDAVVRWMRAQPLTEGERDLVGARARSTSIGSSLQMLDTIGRISRLAAPIALVLDRLERQAALETRHDPTAFKRLMTVLVRLLDYVPNFLVVISCEAQAWTHAFAPLLAPREARRFAACTVCVATPIEAAAPPAPVSAAESPTPPSEAASPLTPTRAATRPPAPAPPARAAAPAPSPPDPLPPATPALTATNRPAVSRAAAAPAPASSAATPTPAPGASPASPSASPPSPPPASKTATIAPPNDANAPPCAPSPTPSVPALATPIAPPPVPDPIIGLWNETVLATELPPTPPREEAIDEAIRQVLDALGSTAIRGGVTIMNQRPVPPARRPLARLVEITDRGSRTHWRAGVAITYASGRALLFELQRLERCRVAGMFDVLVLCMMGASHALPREGKLLYMRMRTQGMQTAVIKEQALRTLEALRTLLLRAHAGELALEGRALEPGELVDRLMANQCLSQAPVLTALTQVPFRHG